VVKVSVIWQQAVAVNVPVMGARSAGYGVAADDGVGLAVGDDVADAPDGRADDAVAAGVDVDGPAEPQAATRPIRDSARRDLRTIVNMWHLLTGTAVGPR
jgi:hypothetical protein